MTRRRRTGTRLTGSGAGASKRDKGDEVASRGFYTMRAELKATLAGLLAVVLASCASTPPPDTYEISAPAVLRAIPGATRAQILIPEPTAIKTLDSERIVIKPTTLTVQYLAGSQWSDRLPRMVQLRLLQAFENTGKAGAVGVPGQGLAIDYQLVMEIRRFEVMVTGAPVAVVEISVKALNDRNGSVIRTRVFEQRSPLAGPDNANYVAALDRAFDAITRDIVTWTVALI